VNWLLPQPVNLTFRTILQIAYALACMVMLIRYLRPRTPQSNRPGKQTGFVYQWLWVITLFVFINAAYYLSVVILYYDNPDLGRRMMFTFKMLYLTGGILTFLPFLILFFPQILYGIPKYRPRKNENVIPATSPNTTMSAAAIVPTPPEPSKPDADEQQINEEDPFQELGARIHAIMEEKKPYRQENFSLEDLARILEVPKHHIHYCLRNILNTRFISLRTSYRLDHAKELLLQSDISNTTIENIGQECGFSSRSAFYKVFKSEVGCSPGEFVEREKKQKEDGAGNNEN
jgi:AraC-like DNA-binding protein